MPGVDDHQSRFVGLTEDATPGVRDAEPTHTSLEAPS